MNSNNDEIYLRKDLYEAKEDNLITAINDLRELINESNKHVDRVFTALGMFIAFAAVIVPILLVTFFK